MRVTLRDVAQQANVSVSTASRVLNQYEYVSDETRATVLQAAQEVGYPLEKLRGSAQISRSVLFMGMEREQDGHQPMDNEFSRLVLDGAQSVLEHHDTAARLQSAVRLPQDKAKRVQQLADDPGMAGLILLGGCIDEELLRLLQAVGVPFVIAGGYAQNLNANCVMADYQRGMEQAVAHLVSRGRRRIGLVNGPNVTMTSHEKYNGFRLASCLHALEFNPDLVQDEAGSPEAGHTLTLRTLEKVPDTAARRRRIGLY